MVEVGEDSLGGEFLSGIMGSTYEQEMESGFTTPYAYMKAAPTVNVFGSPVSIQLDSVLVYRGCPYLKDMSYILTNLSPPAGYTAQQLLDVLNVSGTYPHADGATYVEYQGLGQCVSLNFDLCSTVNHSRGYCDGSAQSPAPDFNAGDYYGRADLMHTILHDLFGLEPSGGGAAGTTPQDRASFAWALSQNAPNPVAAATEIRYGIASRCDVRIRVFNTTGQLVRTLVKQSKDPGRYSASWDGTNAAGQRVSSGMYFYTMDGGGFRATKKMLVVR